MKLFSRIGLISVIVMSALKNVVINPKNVQL